MQTFSFPVRVYYEDTDAGGVVYYANYLKFMERARTEWLRGYGFEQAALARESHLIFAVCRVRIDFLKPARLDDALEVRIALLRLGRARLTFHQEVLRPGTDERLARATVDVAALDAESFRPKRIPDFLYKDLRREV